MSTKEQAGTKQKAVQQQKSKAVTEGLEQSPAQAEAVAAAQKVLAFPRPPLDPDDILALQRTAGNRVVQRLLEDHPSLQPIVLASVTSPTMVQRTNGDGLAELLTQGGTIPINIQRSIPFGAYAANLELHGAVQINPFEIRVTGEPNGITITEGEEERATLLFREDGDFHSLGFNLAGQGARLDEEGRFTAESELGPVSLAWDGEDRQLSVTLDVLGVVWPPEMQAMVEDVGEVTSDFNLVFNVPEEGPITLGHIGMDLGIAFGPEQVRTIAELSIGTTYEEGLEYTEASGNVEVQINVFGIEETITLYDDAASGADLGIRHERQLVQTALRYAFLETYREIQTVDEAEMREDIALRDIQRGFNEFYGYAYRRARNDIIERYAEHEIDNVRMYDGSDRRPVTTFGINPILEGECRNNITQVILPHPDPPGSNMVTIVWNRALQRE